MRDAKTLEWNIQTGRYLFPGDGNVEVVERKGLGHPDTICDALAEEISRALCRAYLRQFGEILHHNVDKILLRGGIARPGFGVGEILEPLEFYLGGRATAEFRGVSIPVDDIAVEACDAWLRAHLPDLDLRHHVRFIPAFRPGSATLRGVFSRGRPVVLSNDTSCAVGFAPFTSLERMVLEIERTLNSAETKHHHPAIGQDIKVMGVRRGSRVHLTVACGMIGRYLAGTPDYLAARAVVLETTLAAAHRVAAFEVDASVNAADDISREEMFLTVTGTSADSGDDGEVGRGNRASGLITPYRPMSIEALAGKNPVNHVGKLYNITAGRIANRVATARDDVAWVNCMLVSQIGRAIDDPQVVDVQLGFKDGGSPESVAAFVKQIVADELRNFGPAQQDLLAGLLTVY